jgi:hypothetical protein
MRARETHPEPATPASTRDTTPGPQPPPLSPPQPLLLVDGHRKW